MASHLYQPRKKELYSLLVAAKQTPGKNSDRSTVGHTLRSMPATLVSGNGEYDPPSLCHVFRSEVRNWTSYQNNLKFVNENNYNNYYHNILEY